MSEDAANSALWEALGAVRDPELDEAITDLGFVGEAVVEDGLAHVRLRLPTFFCAANFAYLMLHDAREAAKAVPGVRQVDVQLDDHFASDELNEGVVNERGFQETFEGLADGELDEIRDIFRRKAFIARQDRLARALMAEGFEVEALTDMRVGQLPDTEATRTYLERRTELGLDVGPQAPFLVNAAGRPVPPDEARVFLRQGRTTRLNIEANAGFCRAVLQARYPSTAGATADEDPVGATAGQPSEQRGATR